MTNETWLHDALRERLQSQNADDLSPFEQRFRERMLSALDEPVTRSDGELTLRDDAEEVLADARDELLDELIDDLDSLVSRARKSGGVILSDSEIESDGGSLWDRILASQLRSKMKDKMRKSDIDMDAYRERWGSKSRTLENDVTASSEWMELFGN